MVHDDDNDARQVFIFYRLTDTLTVSLSIQLITLKGYKIFLCVDNGGRNTKKIREIQKMHQIE